MSEIPPELKKKLGDADRAIKAVKIGLHSALIM